MTLLSVVKDVCAAVGVQIPQSVFSNVAGNRTMQEMVSLANEMAKRIAYDTRDWKWFTVGSTITGTGDEWYNLPPDFRRFPLTTNMWRSTSALYPMRFIPDYDQWIQRRLRHIYSPHGEWRLQSNGGSNSARFPGGTAFIQFFPALATGTSVAFNYINRAPVEFSGGVREDFLDDNDTFALDERLLKLGMIWQWKAQKGSPYAEDLATYNDALNRVSGADSPAPIIIGRLPIIATSAYPWPIPF